MEPEEKTVLCEKCQKQINAPNFIIHQAMCRGNRESFILGGLNKIKSKSSKTELEKPDMQIEPPLQINKKSQPGVFQYPKLNEETNKHHIFQNPNIDKHQTKNMHKQTIPPSVQPNKTVNQPKPQQSIEPSQKPNTKPIFQPKPPKKQLPPEPEQRFRCTDCGYMMTMKELDSHPKECPARHKKCQYCGLQFPHYLMEMHTQVCEKSPNQRQQRRPSSERQHIRQQLQRRQQEEEQQRQRARQRQQRGNRQGHIPANIVPVSTQTYVTRQGNYRVTVKRVMDQNGRIYEQRYRQPLQQQSDQQDDGFRIIVPISMGSGGGISVNNLNQLFSGGNGFQQIIRRLMTNMNINRQQNPGLSKEEVAKIPIVKYDPSTSPKSTSCTICVTDLQRGDQVMKLPCGHLFNPQCLIPWLKNSSVCPNCRGKVKPN